MQASQTKASFDYQWAQLPTGRALPSDSGFMPGVPASLVEMVGQPGGWFPGKRVLDVGCGGGRYSCGLLSLSAEVVACDQSAAALQSTARVCQAFADRRIDLLEWSEPAALDLASCYGVVHHTGNTYLAREDVCRKVRPGGRVFFMIYAPPLPRGFGSSMCHQWCAVSSRFSMTPFAPPVVRRKGRDQCAVFSVPWRWSGRSVLRTSSASNAARNC